jgi:hypothetical protein
LSQDFPYNFAAGIEHWLLWCTEPLPPTLIQEKMVQQFPDKDYDTIFFVNPPQLQSVLAVSVYSTASWGAAAEGK